MSSNTKKLIILTIGLLLFSAILNGLFGVGFPGLSLFNKNTSFGAAKTFSLNSGFSRINIDSKTGNIRFYNAGRGSGKVVWSGSNNMKLTVGTRGDTLEITEKYKLPWFLRIGIHLGKSEIAVYLPQKEYKLLDADSDTGSITIPEGFTFTDAEVETDTGSIDFHADVRNHLKIDTDTGRIICSGFKPESVEIESDTGSLNVSSVRASRDIQLKSDTGRVSLANVIAGGEMSIETDTGSIELNHCDAGTLDIKSDTGSVHGTLLTEKTFITKSATGRVDVPLSSFGGECKIKTATGSITIRIER